MATHRIETDILRAHGNGKAYAAYLEDCQACFLCVIDCPVGAIAIEQEKVPIHLLGPRPIASTRPQS